MAFNDWPLVIFSILAQMAVGSFCVLTLVSLLAARSVGQEQAERLTGRGWWAIVAVMGVALLASLTHLGSPLNAWKAILNVGEAWLSREILMALVFFLLAAVYAFLHWRKAGSASLRTVVALLAALAGLILVFCMSMIYAYIRTQPAWNTPITNVTFYLTTLLLGTLGGGSILAANYLSARDLDPDCAEIQCTLLQKSLQWVALSALVLLGLEMVALPQYLTELATGSSAAQETVRLLRDNFGLLVALRVILVFAGAGVLSLFLYRVAANRGRERVMGYLTYSAFAVVVVGEVIGRFLFYAAHVRMGF